MTFLWIYEMNVYVCMYVCTALLFALMLNIL